MPVKETPVRRLHEITIIQLEQLLETNAQNPTRKTMIINSNAQHEQTLPQECKFIVDLQTLTDRDFGFRKRMPVTCTDYYQIVDYCDVKDWYWDVVSDTDHKAKKEAWCNQFMFFRNKLRLVDDFSVLADRWTTYVARDLNNCRRFCAIGGHAIWVDQGRLFAVKCDDLELLPPLKIGMRWYGFPNSSGTN
jgi:hypothetical protein